MILLNIMNKFFLRYSVPVDTQKLSANQTFLIELKKQKGHFDNYLFAIILLRTNLLN